MLVLTRRRNETVNILIPPSDKPRVVQVTVVDSRQGNSRLGFTADRDISIVRDDARTDGASCQLAELNLLPKGTA